MRPPNRVPTAPPVSPGVSRALRRLGIVFHRGRSYRGYWQDRTDGVRVIVHRTEGPPWTPDRMRGQPIVVYQTAPDGREIVSERYFPDVSAFIASAVVANPRRRTLPGQAGLFGRPPAMPPAAPREIVLQSGLAFRGYPVELVHTPSNTRLPYSVRTRHLGELWSADTLDEAQRFYLRELSDEERRKLTTGRLVFSTVHKIKGAEAWRTFILEETFRFNRAGFGGVKAKMLEKMSEPEKVEEQNLFYVAITRVKNLPGKPGELYYVQGLKFLLGGSGDE